MATARPVFAVNHMAAPRLSPDRFFAMVAGLGLSAVEIRNDLAGNAILDGTPATEIRSLARRHGLAILTINALQRFNEWTDARANEAVALADYARDCGAGALVLVPKNDGTGLAAGARGAGLRRALTELAPILAARGLLGLVEPLGFETCSLRHKAEAVEAIGALGLAAHFRILHDTFHHCLAGGGPLFPRHTGLIHISGVTDSRIGVAGMRDGHRVLVDGSDRLGNLAQIAALLAGGADAPLSFEPFADKVADLADIAGALRRSMEFVRSNLARAAG